MIKFLLKIKKNDILFLNYVILLVIHNKLCIKFKKANKRRKYEKTKCNNTNFASSNNYSFTNIGMNITKYNNK